MTPSWPSWSGWARACWRPLRSTRSPPGCSMPTRTCARRRSVAPAPTSPRSPASPPRAPRRCSSRRCRPTSPTSPGTRSSQEKLMPILGLVRSPSVDHALDVCALVTEHGGLGHTSAVYATDEDVIARFSERDQDGPDPRQRADRRGRARRRLQPDDPDLLARLRHLGRRDDDGQRQLPQPAQHQGGRTAADAAAVVPRPLGHVLQHGRAGEPARRARILGGHRHRRRHRAPRRGRGRPAPSRRLRRAGLRGHRARADRGTGAGGRGDARRPRGPS